MNYFFLKLGHGNSEAGSLLGRSPKVTIYYDHTTKRQYRLFDQGHPSVRKFVNLGTASRAQAVFVVVNRGVIWLLEPAGPVRFGKREKAADGTWVTAKTMPVRVLKRIQSKNVPPVLAGIACSQSLGRRTFVSISDWGNLKAIDAVLGRVPKKASDAVEEHWKPDEQQPAQFLECLSSTEFETLVAKLLEAKGCHVPAHRGGTLEDIDLFARNLSKRAISMDGLRIRGNGRIAIQVKRRTNGMRCPKDRVDYLVGLWVKGPRALGEQWLIRQLRASPEVIKWVRRSLDWLPNWYFQLPSIRLPLR
jgi:hypothetical protein